MTERKGSDLWERVHRAYQERWGELPGRWGAIRFDPNDVESVELNRLRRAGASNRRMFNKVLRTAEVL